MKKREYKNLEWSSRPLKLNHIIVKGEVNMIIVQLQIYKQ